MFEINRKIHVPEGELTWSFVRSGGPGGQNVNKVASKAVLRWNVVGSPSLSDEVKERLRARLAHRITNDGDLIVTSQRYRDQERNRQDCLDKLRGLVLEATRVNRPRKPTKPSRGSQERRLAAKRRRSAAKSSRRLPAD